MTDFLTQRPTFSCPRELEAHVLRVICACVLLLGGGGWAAPSVPRSAPSVTFDDSIVELLGILHERRLLRADDEELRRGVLEAIIKAVDCHGVLLKGQGSEALSDVSGNASRASIDIQTVGGVFAYALVSTVSTDAAGDLAGVIDDIGHGHYEGIVLDVRFAEGGEIAAVDRVVSRLAKGSLPVVVLTNGKTVGAPEVLALQARQRCNALTVGQPTRGLPYPRVSERLRSGDVVLLPKVEAVPGGGDDAWVPVQPDVLVEQVLPRETLVQRLAEQLPSDDEGDLCLRRAIDLLTMIHALKQKRF